MTAKFSKSFVAAMTAILIGTTTLATPAMAGGQFSLSFAPQSADQQQVLGLGLLALALVNGVSDPGANVRQTGDFNSAGFNQNGHGNNGLIVQQGNGHKGAVEQVGNNNNCALLQFGDNTTGRCAQYGDNQSSLTTVFGF
ncbi:MAG: curlin [Devosia sp.]